MYKILMLLKLTVITVAENKVRAPTVKMARRDISEGDRY